MTMTINLKPELETKLRKEAARRGVDVDVFIARALQGAVEDAHGQSQNVSLPAAEADLLQKINAGPTDETWDRYKSLVRKRRDETLTSEQHRELIELSDQIEEDHARRIGQLAQLAQMRGGYRWNRLWRNRASAPDRSVWTTSMTRPTSAQREGVTHRAGGHCEYCRSPENLSPSPFSMEHIFPTARRNR